MSATISDRSGRGRPPSNGEPAPPDEPPARGPAPSIPGPGDGDRLGTGVGLAGPRLGGLVVGEPSGVGDAIEVGAGVGVPAGTGVTIGVGRGFGFGVRVGVGTGGGVGFGVGGGVGASVGGGVGAATVTVGGETVVRVKLAEPLVALKR
jgi:hypothetical protein